MEIKKKYLTKYLYDLSVEQLADEYAQKGYVVTKEESIEDYKADLIARKPGETIIIEIKSGKLTPTKKAAIAGIADYTRTKKNHKFLVVVASPPKEKKIFIEEIGELLTEHIMNDLPSGLDELSTHTSIEEVADVEIDEIDISGDEIYVVGNGSVTVELQYGSDSDQPKGDGFKSSDNFPLTFSITLEFTDNRKLHIKSVDEFEVDTSSYYI